MFKRYVSLFLLFSVCTCAPMKKTLKIAHHDTVGELLKACAEGNLKKVKEEIEIKEIDPYWRTFADKGHPHRGQAAIHVASEYGKLNVLKYLIEENKTRKAVINGGSASLDIEGYSPLDLAAKNNHIDTVKYLLLTTSNYSKKTYDSQENLECKGKNALHHAAENGHLGIVKIIHKKNKPWIYDKDADGNTPLHLASQGGNFDVVQYLVTNKLLDFFINAKNNNGYTPLDVSKTKAIYYYLKDECGAVSNKWSCVIS